MIAYLMLLTALLLSGVAAYYSIIGLTAIFAGAFWPVVIMGSTLEFAKVVTTSWLYRNWNNIPATIKYYLAVAVIILMFITSMGIFGYLSKAHIDQTSSVSGSSIELQVIEEQIESEKRRIENAQRSLTALDRLVDQTDPVAAIKLRSSQTRERTSLNNVIQSSSNVIKDLNTQAAPLRKELKQIAAEVGPLKYIADLLYNDASEDTLEKAVRAVIIIIVLVFDPLALAMLVAANISFKKRKTYYKRKNTLNKKKKAAIINKVKGKGIVVDPKSIIKM